jgi:thioredoxin reductase
LQARCYSCHFEHPSESPAKIAAPRPVEPPALASAKLLQASQGGLLFFGLFVTIPLFYFVSAAVRMRFDHRRLGTQTAASLVSALPAAASDPPPPLDATVPAYREPKSTDNQAPGGNLRPKIDLDLCVGCGSCVHVCPFGVLEIVNEKAIAARLGDCTGFAACAAECPTEAITLVQGGAMQTQELPVYDSHSLETNVPGLYLAGEVTGKALIKIAINQGKQVVDAILRNRPQPGDHYDVIVVGAGPAGTSAALAARAEGLRVLVLEQGTVANTIRNYPRQKFVMAEPVMIPAYGPLWIEDTGKEALLERWEQVIKATGLVIQEGESVLSVTLRNGLFYVETARGQYPGARVVMAIGKRGTARKLNVPGEDLSKVAYNLLDADSYRGKSICIVGGGDSSIEAAVGLARADLGNRVWLVHRGEDFGKAKARNQKKIRKAIEEKRVMVFFNSTVIEIGPAHVAIQTPQEAGAIPNDFVFVMAGGESPKKFLTQSGIAFSTRALG